MADKGEWYPYAFLPFLWSFGGDLVDRSTYQTAEGALNGDAAIEWGEWFQGLVQATGWCRAPRRASPTTRTASPRASTR